MNTLLGLGICVDFGRDSEVGLTGTPAPAAALTQQGLSWFRSGNRNQKSLLEATVPMIGHPSNLVVTESGFTSIRMASWQLLLQASRAVLCLELNV